MLPYVAESSNAALAVPSSVRWHRWRDVWVAILTARRSVKVRLLLSVLSDIARETVFALKGDTAINLFYRDVPRLSVEIDFAYLPVAGRQSALEEIDEAFNRIATAITEHNPRVKARRIAGGGNNDTRITVSDGSAQIKIETSPVTRGAVYPARTMVASATRRLLAIPRTGNRIIVIPTTLPSAPTIRL